MIRIVIENLFAFLLPTFLYLVWYAFRATEWPGLGRVLGAAPLGKLFVSGAVLMLAALALFSSRAHNTPGDVYAPPEFKDGKLQPGHRVAPEPK